MHNTIYKVGFWAGTIAFSSTTAFFIVQLLQLAGVLNYPLDQILIYGFPLLIVIPFILEILALHYVTSVEKKFWSHAALFLQLSIHIRPRYNMPLVLEQYVLNDHAFSLHEITKSHYRFPGRI